jgi:hypothetical protein
MLLQATVSPVVGVALRQENEVLKLSMNSLRDNLRKAVVERLGSMVDILLL